MVRPTGKVQTVLGPVDPDSLGITSTHEHLVVDVGCYYRSPEEASERAWIDAPLTLDRLGGIVRRLRYNLDNQRLYDIDIALEEVSRFKLAGGGSIVDATSIGVGRDPLALARLSRATGLNIVMGGGYYVTLSHPPDMHTAGETEIAEQIIRDVTVGVGDTGIRSGIIGEIGNFWPMSDVETKVLRASVHAQRATGVPILIHPGFQVDSPASIMDVLIQAGAHPSQVIMGHLDMFHDRGMLDSLAESGCYLSYDGFGMEDTALDAIAHQSIDLPSDLQRLGEIEFLMERGYVDKIVVAHDICVKYHYGRYGGKTFDHLLTSVVPQMRKRGFTQEQIDAILVENPKRILTVA